MRRLLFLISCAFLLWTATPSRHATHRPAQPLTEAQWEQRVFTLADQQRIVGDAFAQRLDELEAVADAVGDTVAGYISAVKAAA